MVWKLRFSNVCLILLLSLSVFLLLLFTWLNQRLQIKLVAQMLAPASRWPEGIIMCFGLVARKRLNMKIWNSRFPPQSFNLPSPRMHGTLKPWCCISLCLKDTDSYLCTLFRSTGTKKQSPFLATLLLAEPSPGWQIIAKHLLQFPIFPKSHRSTWPF